MTKRISLLGGPGCGKSTMAASVFSWMKTSGLSVEYAYEYVKWWAYDRLDMHPFDQVFLMGQQMRIEYIPLRNGVDYVVSDSPLFLSACYALQIGCPGWEHLFGIVREFDKAYPSLYMFLERGDARYEAKEGRYQDQQGAVEMDSVIKSCLLAEGVSYSCFKYDDLDGIKGHIWQRLK